jgi:gluconate 5-dehydrogenase
VFSLAGKTALVTGARRGLGLAIARGLAAAGAHVALNARDGGALARCVAQLAADGYSVEPLAFDVRDEAACERALNGLVDRRERLDILVNNVGQRDRRTIDALSITDFRDILDADLISAFALSRSAARGMIAAKHGRIINVTSIAAQIATAGAASYIAAKAGLGGLTRALAVELGPHAITVNAIAPGFFATETNKAMLEDSVTTRWLATRTSLGRWGRPEEIAGAAVFLASDEASYITGQTITVDGGMTSQF